MRNEGYGTWSVQVRLSVCLSVSSYSCITGYEAAHEQYQRLQNYEYLKNMGVVDLFALACLSTSLPSC